LSFLKLFKSAQDQANTLTQRHLDFYYKEVLQLFPAKALPNKAHIIVELAKQTSSYLIAKGRLFKAGKDSLGKEVSYAMDRDVVFNKAKVASLLAVTNQGRLFASPLTNSADGLGAIFNATAMPKAAIGFALASHYLYLTEGERLVNIKFSPAFTSNQQDALKHADCYLSS